MQVLDNCTAARVANSTQFLRRNGSAARSSSNDHSLKYIGDHGENTSEVAFQECSGVPVETRSPLGYSVGPVTIIFLNISSMIGTGIFSTPSAILAGTSGSPALALLLWSLGYIISLSTLTVYLEYASYFPSRSGGEVVYLEQAYPRPKYMLLVIFAIQSAVFSYNSSNAIVMAQYLFVIGDYEASSWELKGLAMCCFSAAVLVVLFSTRAGYQISNTVGMVKLGTLVFISILGLVILGGHTRVHDPKANFRKSWWEDSSKPDAYGVTNAIYKIVFSYAGFQNGFNVVNEVKDPVRKLRNQGYASVTIVAALYILANVAFFAAIPKNDIILSKQTVASLLLPSVFGSQGSIRALNNLIALSAFGNLVASLLGQSRMLRECGRQGVLPYPRFRAATKPFNTPASPYLVKWLSTLVMILAPPAGDAFNFITDLAVYPNTTFILAMSVGIYLLRSRRPKASLPRSMFQTWHVVLIFNILVQIYLLVLPWYPPRTEARGGDVSFWYATYVVVGIGILVACGMFYVVWMILLPRIFRYKFRQQVLLLDNGAQTQVLVKVPGEESLASRPTRDRRALTKSLLKKRQSLRSD